MATTTRRRYTVPNFIRGYEADVPSEVVVAESCSRWFFEGVMSKREEHGAAWPLFVLAAFSPAFARRRGIAAVALLWSTALVAVLVAAFFMRRAGMFDMDAWRAWKANEVMLLRDSLYTGDASHDTSSY